MPYATAYQINHKPIDGIGIMVNIYDTKTTTTGATNFIDLGYGPDKKYPAAPFAITIIDNNNDKFNPIRAKQATISFLSGTYDASTFSSGEDNRFFVEALVPSSGDIIFRGFILMDDNQQPLLPNPQVVTLTATDNLGTLKEVALVDDTGANPKKENKIIKYIAWALAQTGLQLNINVCDSYFEESYPGLPACNNIYLHAKTFEKEIGVSEDCYTVLQKLLAYRLFLTQWHGEWWIINIDEYGLPVQTAFKFDYQGSVISSATPDFSQTIGRTHDMIFARRDQLVRFQRAHKYAKLTWQFEFPKEIIDNIDFSRGDLAPISLGANSAAYVVDDWTQHKGYGTNSVTPDFSAYIQRNFVNGYEKERFLVLTQKTVAGANSYLTSNPIPVEAKDKFSCSVDFRWSLNKSGSFSATFIVMAIRLVGNDGSFWVLNPSGTWMLSNANFSVNFQPIQSTQNAQDDETQWTTKSVQSKPLPVAGDVLIDLYAMNQLTSTYDDVDVYYQNLQFDYQPYMNGSYQKYNAISRKVSQAGGYKANIDDTVYIYDGTRKLFKGAMLKLVSGKYVVTGNWYAGAALAAQGITPPIPSQYLHPLGHLQIYAVWNQANRDMKIIEGSVKGLRTVVVGGIPDMVHLYAIDLVNNATTNKQFVPAKADSDFNSTEWRITLIEVNDTTIAKDFTSPEEVKYSSEY